MTLASTRAFLGNSHPPPHPPSASKAPESICSQGQPYPCSFCFLPPVPFLSSSTPAFFSRPLGPLSSWTSPKHSFFVHGVNSPPQVAGVPPGPIFLPAQEEPGETASLSLAPVFPFYCYIFQLVCHLHVFHPAIFFDPPPWPRSLAPYR